MLKKYLLESKRNSISYIDKILDGLKNNLIESSNKNDEKNFSQILLFFRDQAFDSLINNSLVYTQIINVPAEIYAYLSREYKRKVIELFTIRFAENISFISFYESYDSKYLEITYWGLLQLIKKIFDENDYESFNLIFEKMRESGSLDFGKRSDLEYYHHAFFFSVTSWGFYLHQNNMINFLNYDFTYLEEPIESDLYDNREKIVNNFYRFEREAEKGILEVNNWEFIKPQFGAYFALTSHTWLNFGFLIILLKYDILNYGIKIENIDLNDRFKFIIDDVKTNLNLVKTNFGKWSPIIAFNLYDKTFEEIFDFKEEKINNLYTELNKRQEILKYTAISQIPLSTSKIEEFKQRVGNLWDKNSFIPTILKFYETVNYKPNKKTKDGFGFFQNILKMRFAFIDGEYYQSVYGLTDFGAKVANSVNEYFFNELLKIKETKKALNLKNQIDTFLSGIKDHSKIVIFSNWKGNEILNYDGIVIDYNNKKNIPFSNSSYKNIPIISNPAYRNLVFIINLNDIKYNIYQDNNWYKSELLIDVTEPKFDNIENESENEENWKRRDGVTYSKEEILTLEKNAIHIKILFKFDLKILKKKSFEIYTLKESTF